MGHSLNTQLWQGYGGNIYFDAVRCQSMRINSAKSGHSRKKDRGKRWKSKSCTPLKRRDEQKAHTTCIPSAPVDVPRASIHSLGSLRIRSCKEKKCRLANCKHKDTASHLQPGKICKGFGDKLVTEKFQKLQEDRGFSLAKESLAVSGGQVGDSLLDPIDRVQQFNTQYGIPALLTDSSFFSHQVGKKSSSVASGDGDPFIKLPLLSKHEGKQRTNKPDSRGSEEGSNQVSEPRPVFIIPFGSFDDPVDTESDLKRKMDKKEKASCRNSGDGIDTSVGSTKGIDIPPEGPESSSTLVVENHNVNNATFRENNNEDVKHPVTASGAMGHGNFKQGVPDFHLKREISNLSLSNYLRAIPTRKTKEQNRLSPPQSAMMPKMSYTKRSRAMPTFYMVNNSLHHMHHSGFNQRMNASQVYGGYFPTTDRKESKLFYAEISTCTEQNSMNSSGSMQDPAKRTNSSGSNRTNSSSPRIPKHAHVNTSYVSRNSFTRQNGDRSPRVNESLSNSGKNLLPVTGQQISRFSGIHDR